MAKKNRDEFTEKTKLQIAKRAGWHCSDPSCHHLTVGSNSTGDGEINLGTAAHICAAAPGGPRYDPNQTSAQRCSADNGIWMCRLHGAAVDAQDSKYTVELLREWKAQAQKDSWQGTLYGTGPLTPAWRAPTEGELSTRLHTAAVADLEVFRRTDKWPSTAIPLMLKVDGFSDPVNASALATALITLDDLILVAPPGMGKTTTLFQVAEAVLAKGNASPIIVPLGDWSTDGAPLLESVLKRPAFRAISEADLRTVAAKPGVILLLDAWNELDASSRKRLAAQIARLQAELPELSLLISTRQQVLDVPVNGTRISLLPLSEKQQLDIAKALRGDAGVRMVDQAWRTAGVRELVTIPLYLTALLALPEGARFPTTKEEVLRYFVAVHEENTQRAEALAEVSHGLHQRFLKDLAVTATRAVNTTIAESAARKSVSETDDALVAEGQITEKPQPNAVLEALVSHHVLMRIGDPAGYSFQHQQFQEWYASHFVEHLMLASIGDAGSRDKLKADVLNQPAWEEAILFASERLARGDQQQQEACCAAILAAFEVDPTLAAEMIFRSNDAVWAGVASTIQGLVRLWHTPGRVDRALRFMISSGRPEFLEQVWPLITHENDQVHLSALRAGRRFRPSLLGSDAAKRIAALPPNVRKNVLHEIAFNSGIDGLDLAAAIAKDDPDPEVKATAIRALAFRRADQHVADVLRHADEKTFDLVAREGLVDETIDEHVKKGIEAARERQRQDGVSDVQRLRTILHAQGDEDLSGEVAAIIANMEIDKARDAEMHLFYELRNRYSRAIADGFLQRVRTGRTLFYGTDELLVSAGFSLEDDGLLEIALSETGRRDYRAEAAACVLGPQSVGRMMEAVREAKKRLRDAGGKYDQAAGDRYHDLLDRIGHTPSASLIAAVRARSPQARNEEMADLAELIYRHSYGGNDRGKRFDADALAAIGALAEDWGNRMLASGDATRWQLASIATVTSYAPSVRLLPLLKRLLDEDLRRFRAFREEANATGWRPGKATNEARMLHTHAYQRAFQAINAPETAAMMREYLQDEHFGQLAALVLAAQWTAANEPSDGERFRFRGGVDFSRVEEKRAARASNPAATSPEAEAIFKSIEPLIADDATEDQKKHAVALGIVAVRLPHGQRDATIQKLISLAPRRSRAALLQSLILSGECIDIEMVKKGIAEVFEAAKTQRWILSENGYELKEWLRLLPFTTPPAETLVVVRSLPDDQRRADRLEEMIAGFETAPGDDAENVLFQLAEDDPRLYANHAWRDAAMRRGTLSAARRLVNLAANDAFEDKGMDRWHMTSRLAGLMDEHPELRTHIYQLLENGATTPGLARLAQAVAENPDADGLLLLIKIEIDHKGSFISRHTIENVVTKHVPSEGWKGAYNVVPVPVVDLRRKLLAITTDGGPMDVAARCLNRIDKIRDEYGTPDFEPRHPDLASGKPWPIMMPDPDMSET
jgi:alkylhydroperoxidase/carboxymuconolactone decarboxylase family protein YurZ